MADTMASTAAPASERSVVSPSREILRDIARGGFAGAIVGVVVAGLGGRLVMRLAAILQPGAVGALSENGNRIGDITFLGSLGLVVVGLVIGLAGGTIWVVVSPWTPGTGLRRAIITLPMAVALGSFFLIEGDNRDFQILQHDPVVVASLIVLVALVGLTLPLTYDWLGRRLPHATSGRSGATWPYAIIALLGAFLVLPIVIGSYLFTAHQATVRVGLALLVVGLSTLTWWVLRIRGRAGPLTILTIVGRTALSVAVVLGFAATVPEVSIALGMT